MVNANLARIQPQIDEAERLAWLRLARSENVGPITFTQLLEHFGSAQRALENLQDLAAKGGRTRPILITSLEDAEKEYRAHQKAKVHLLLAKDPFYPAALATLADAPPVLSVLGDCDLLTKHSLAIVGARNASLNGKRFAETLAQDLGQHGWIITSGLARGIDTHAHKGALPTGTVAVLAGGVDHVYPPENQALYDAIKEKGAIISEAPFGTTPKSHFFPRRNRIISGLSAGVIVVEAAEKSGSLITARNALEQGREVFAVPGSPYDPRHRGCNALIKQGATLVQGVEDVLKEISSHRLKETLSEMLEPVLKAPQTKKAIEVTHHHRFNVEENLSPIPVGLDELARQCQICPEELLCIILELELAGKVIRCAGNKVALTVI